MLWLVGGEVARNGDECLSSALEADGGAPLVVEGLDNLRWWRCLGRRLLNHVLPPCPSIRSSGHSFEGIELTNKRRLPDLGGEGNAVHERQPRNRELLNDQRCSPLAF